MRQLSLSSLLISVLAIGVLRTAAVADATVPNVGARNLLRSLAGKHRATIADGVCVTALFAGLSKGDDTYVRARKRLLTAHMLRSRDASEPRDVLTHGLASLLFFNAMHMKGGLITRLFTPTPRYAYKELVYLGLIAENGEGAPMTGDDLLGLLKLATVYRKQGAL